MYKRVQCYHNIIYYNLALQCFKRRRYPDEHQTISGWIVNQVRRVH